MLIQLLTWSLGLIAVYLVYIFGFCFFLKPYSRIKTLLSWGGIGKFTYGPQFFLENTHNAIRTGHSMTPYLEIMNKNPKTKFLVRNIGHQPLIILMDPEMIKVFLQNQHYFDKSWHFKEMNKEFDSGLLYTYGENWRQTRMLLSPQFHFESLKKAVPIIIDCVKKTFIQWAKQEKLQNNVIQMFSEASADVILKYLFNINSDAVHTENGKSISVLLQEYTKDLTKVNGSLSRILLGASFVEKGILPSHKELNRKKSECIKLSKQLIGQVTANGLPEHTYLHALLQAKDEKEDKYDENRITADLINLLIAGTETNAHTLGFAIYYLHKHPEVLQKLLEEIDRELPDLDKLSLDTINQLDYTNAVIKETLRLACPVPWIFPRDVVRHKRLGNLVVSPGDLVTVFFPLFHLSEKYYSKPLEYIPERWLPDGPFPNDGHKGEPYAYMPFSSGQRNCIGQFLAMIEAKVMLILFVKTFRFKFPAGYELKLNMLDFTEPVEPLNVTLEPISSL